MQKRVKSKVKSKKDRKIILVSLVVAGCSMAIALAVWWLIHGLNQITALAQLEPELSQFSVTQQRMILSEGAFFILLLLLGGVTLITLLFREFKRNEQMRVFFATFTHELKTPLASLRLQAEVLAEDANSDSHPLIQRLLSDTSRLELQLENALFLATVESRGDLHLEPIELESFIKVLQASFPDFHLESKGNAVVHADRRALDSILKNLVQNARVHGESAKAELRVEKSGSMVQLTFVDGGVGFQGNSKHLGRLFHRHGSRSGSGVGLHLCRTLAERMGGKFQILDRKLGFAIGIDLPSVGPG